MKLLVILFFIHCMAFSATAAVKPTKEPQVKAPSSALLLRKKLESKYKASSKHRTPSLIFDLPVTYNPKVGQWISYFQGRGSKWFNEWLERSFRFLPMMQHDLKSNGLPQDLAYMVMIESGFSAQATSTASAVGPWQFIKTTGERYGLQSNSWLDERRDFKKSTMAAIRYIQDLYKEFNSWYLVAAAYNMGENGLRRLTQKHQTKDFWRLAKIKALPRETEEYVPKILAAMLISKAPALYGFNNISSLSPLDYELVKAPGGTDLEQLADHLGVTRRALKELNAELIRGYIPRYVETHTIRVPRGSVSAVLKYFELQNRKIAME